MATVTKTFVENFQTSYKSTWTVTMSQSDVTVSNSSFTFPVPTMTAKYVYAGKKNAYVSTYAYMHKSGQTQWLLYGTWYRGTSPGSSTNTLPTTSGTTYTLSTSEITTPTQYTSNFFTSQNPTVRTIPISVTSASLGLCSQVNTGPTDPTLNDYDGTSILWENVFNLILDAPPTFTASALSGDTDGYWAGATTVSTTISSASAKYGGNIVSSSLTIGNQTVSGSGNGTLSISLANAGTFTPQVSVTDSRGQVTTKTLDTITVNPYLVPSVSFDVYRTDASGVKSDEGTYGLIVADITYTDAIATITEPSVTIDGTATSNVTWYSNYSSSTGVSSAISDWSSLTPTDHSVTVYGLVNESFNIGQSYVIGMSDEDSLGGQSQTVSQTLSTAFYTIDFQAGGKEIAFGAPANDDLTLHPNGLFKCNMDVRFEGDISGISTSTPVEDTIAEFDSSAHMNSTDMTAQEIQDFVDGNLSGQEAITRNDLRSVLDDVLPTRTLLWTNPNPSASSFGPQNISLSGAWDTYDYIEILYLASYTANIDVGQQVMERTPCHAETTVSYVTYSNNRWEIWHRGRWWNAAHTAIHFADAYYDAIGASGSGVWNGNMIPYKIYGIKA